MLYGPPCDPTMELSSQELRDLFLICPTAAHAALSLNTQKPNEFLHIYLSRYSRLHYEAADNTACPNMDPVRSYHLVASINFTSIAEKIPEQVQDTPRTL